MTHNWKNILIQQNKSVRSVLKLIDKEALQVALIVGDHLHLIGVLTDGDVRRGLLNDLTLDSPVRDFMNKHPITARQGTSRDELVRLMKKNEILAIPLMDGPIVTGLETLQRVQNQKKHKNPVFLMAGGFGIRLSPLTDNCPKPLLHVGGKPILQRILENFIDSGFTDFFVSLHYLPDMIKDHFGDGSKWGVSIKYIYEHKPLGTGGALSLLPDDTSDLPLIVINGDILTNVDFQGLLDFHDESKCVATLCVREYVHQVPFGVVSTDGIKVLNMIEKPTQRFFVNAGIYVLNHETRMKVAKSNYLDMPTLLEQEISAGFNVNIYPIHEYWLDIGTHNDFAQAQKDIINLESCK